MRRTSPGSQPPPITAAQLGSLLYLLAGADFDARAAAILRPGLVVNADCARVRQQIRELLSKVLWIDEMSVQLLLEALGGLNGAAMRSIALEALEFRDRRRQRWRLDRTGDGSWVSTFVGTRGRPPSKIDAFQVSRDYAFLHPELKALRDRLSDSPLQPKAAPTPGDVLGGVRLLERQGVLWAVDGVLYAANQSQPQRLDRINIPWAKFRDGRFSPGELAISILAVLHRLTERTIRKRLYEPGSVKAGKRTRAVSL